MEPKSQHKMSLLLHMYLKRQPEADLKFPMCLDLESNRILLSVYWKQRIKYSRVWPGSTWFSEVLTKVAQTVLNICDFIFLTSTRSHIILYKCDESYTASFTKFRHLVVCVCMNTFLESKEFQVSEKDWSIKPAELREQKL